MKSDFEIIRAVVPKADVVRIKPIADVHYASILCNERAFMDFRDQLLKEKNTYTILMGDLLNNNTRSSVGSPWDDVMRPSEAKKKMAEILRPLAQEGKIIGALSGNHERRSLKDADDDPMADIMCKLDLEDIFRQDALFIHLCIGEYIANGKKRLDCTYNIACHHGTGGGAFTGAAVNKNERYAYTIEGIDLLITAHTHRGAMTKPAKICFNPTTMTMIIKPFACMTACSWQAYGGFPLQKMMSPAATAYDGDGQVAEFSGRDRNNKKIRLTW